MGCEDRASHAVDASLGRLIRVHDGRQAVDVPRLPLSRVRAGLGVLTHLADQPIGIDGVHGLHEEDALYACLHHGEDLPFRGLLRRLHAFQLGLDRGLDVLLLILLGLVLLCIRRLDAEK